MKAILAVVLVLALVVSGCNSSAPEQNSTTGNSSQVNTAGLPQASDKNIAKTIEKTPANDASDASTKFKNILASSTKYKVTYDITAAGISSQMTQFVSGDNLRIDTSAGGMNVQTYFANNEYIICNQATGNWMCQKMDNIPTITYNAQNDVRKNIDNFQVTSSGTKLVAGVTTDCYTTENTNSTVEYCYSRDFVPLYMKSTVGNISTEMIAKSYSTSVIDADFTPPAEVGAGISTNPADYLNQQGSG